MYFGQTSSTTLPRRSSASRPPLYRTNSSKYLRIKTTDAPVPPSLTHNPLLQSPESIFRRSFTPLYTPTLHDEEWLGDTVPLSASPLTSRAGAAKGRLRRRATESTTESRSRAECPRHAGPCSCAPRSPPLVHWCRVILKSPWSDSQVRTFADVKRDEDRQRLQTDRAKTVAAQG